MAAGEKPAVFLDRDGVLILDKGYMHRVEDIVLLPGVVAALAALKKAGFALYVITNQSGVARGMFTEDDVARFNAALNTVIGSGSGNGLDGFYVCPHHPEGTVAAYSVRCDCRKPKAGLILQAAKEHGLALSKSFMIGDRPADVDCAIAAGVTPIQVASHYDRHPDARAQVGSLKDALPLIIP